MNYTDEQLSALLDGELDADAQRQLRQAMAKDAQLAKRYADLAMIDTEIKTLFEEIDSQPIPQSIINLLADTDDIPLSNPEPIRQPIAWRPWMNRAAAVLVLGAGIGIGNMMFNSGNTSTSHYASTMQYGPVSTSSSLAQILNHGAMAVKHALPDDHAAHVTPVLSFRHKDGRLCREFTASKADSTNRAVACFDQQQWQIVLTAQGQQSALENEYETASAITPSAFEKQVRNMMEGDPLSIAQEGVLRKRGWHISTSDK